MRYIDRSVEYIERHPWAIVVISLFITAVLAIGILFIKTERSYYKLLPEDSPSVKATKAIGEKLNGADYEYVLIEAPDVTDSRIIQFLIGLNDRVMADSDLMRDIQTTKSSDGTEKPIVQGFLDPFIANMKTEMKNRGIEIPLSSIDNTTVKGFTGKDFQELIEEDYLSNPQVQKEMVGKFITGDKTAALLIFKLKLGLSEAQKIDTAKDLESLFRSGLSETDAKIGLTGEASLTRDFGKHIQNKTILLFIIALAFCIIALFITLRRVFDTFMPIVVTSLGLVGTFGMMGWLNIPITLAAIAIIPLLMGTALTFVVPFISRYYEESMDKPTAGAIKDALLTIGAGLFLAAITNVVGFLAFLFSPLPALKEFGLACAAGTTFIFVLSTTTLPATIVLRERYYLRSAKKRGETGVKVLPWNRKKGWLSRLEDSMLRIFTNVSIKHQVLLMFVCAVLVILGFTQLKSLKTDSDLRELSPSGLPSMAIDYKTEEYFGGRQADLVLIEGDVLSPQSLEAMADFENAVVNDKKNDFRGKLIYERDDIYGLPDILASANNGVIPKTRSEVERAIKSAEANGGILVGTLVSPNRKVTLLTLNASGAQSAVVVERKMEILKSNTGNVLGKSGLDFEIGGITPLTSDLTSNVIPTGTMSSILSVIICGLLLILIFRSFIFGTITLTVAIAGIAAELGFSSLMKWPLDVITSMAPALIIGIGVNFGILFTHRFLYETRKKKLEPEAAVRTTMMNLGKANTVAAVSTVGVFLIIMLSDVVPLSRFGGVTAFSIGCCMIVAHTLMPALLLRYSARRKQKEFIKARSELAKTEPA